jgi:4-carboxymuconolactone decarboxylase
MAGLIPAIHASIATRRAWMPGTRPGMTEQLSEQDLMDTKDLAAKGLKLRKELFGEKSVEQRMNAFGEFGEPLQHIINAYAYGDVWSRPGLSLGVKSLAMIAMMAAANRPQELRVHLKGALKNGCTPDEIREVLLLVALYCGIPAANEAHRAAMDVLAEEKGTV